MRRRAFLAVASAGLLALPACGGTSSGPDEAAGTSVTPTAGSAPTSAPGTEAPDTAPANVPDTAPAPDDVATTPDTADTPDTQAPRPVADILRFASPLVGGGDVDVGAAFGGAPVAFWFWAPS